MNTEEITKRILRKNRLVAKKSYGQNFLVEDNILSQIVESADVTEQDTVVEIGPGLGNLTEYIIKAGSNTIAFEIDQDMIDVLNERFDTPNLNIIKQDILKVDLKKVLIVSEKKVKVIANLPYYITTPIIFKLLEDADIINSITVMVQKEVADRLTAAPHSKDYGVLTIMTNYMSNCEKLFDVPNTAFIPAPNVTSSIVRLTPNLDKIKILGIDSIEIFTELVKKSFSARRKKLANSLANTGIYGLSKEQIENIMKKVELNTNSRAEDVSVKQYAKMSNEILKILKK